MLGLFQEKAKKFKDFRNGNHRLINCLGPVVQVLHTFSGSLDNVARLHLPVGVRAVPYYGNVKRDKLANYGYDRPIGRSCDGSGHPSTICPTHVSKTLTETGRAWRRP